MDFVNFILENNMIVIATLYAIGLILKPTNFVKDKYIPVVLMVIGIVLVCTSNGLSPNSVMQGILTAAAAVYANQLVKQSTK